MSILLLESLHPDAEALLADVDELVRAADPNAPSCDFAAVRAILTRGRGRITAELLQRCPNLQVIARAGVGLDNLDTAAAAARGVPVVFAPGGNTLTVAEHTLALMLDLVRGITPQAVAVAEGRWEDRGRYQGNEIRGLCLGILGFGNVGKRVAQLAEVFGMNVLVATHGGRTVPAPYRAAPLAEVLSTADVITLHLPLTPQTKNLLGAEQLASMKPGAFLINTARGALIDGQALRDALASGHLGGFAADVLEVEPPAADDPLLTSPRALLTPHTASLTALTYRAMCVDTATNVAAILRGEAPAPQSLFRAR
ncbi:MAG: hydroxyacid dehydrogenase [Planctomycetes bacterium]|nr:hydroxyacid dehydrogenase [Myxococcales bacterium]MCB9887529.1 hydroxyacid dehydrogenase [Planctomycetota bacterium]